MKTRKTDGIIIFDILKGRWDMIDKKIHYLSELPETDFPFISLYLSVNAHELFEQREKDRIFIKDSLQKFEKMFHKKKDREKLNSFSKDAEKIRDFLENRLVSKAHGVAVFACDKLGIFEVFYSIMPFENSFSVNSIPHLKQLAYHFDECENALVIMSDKHYSRIFDIKLGGFIINEIDMEHNIHRFHKQGGWAQMRYQRHIENQALIHFKEVAKTAAKIMDNNMYDNLILIGQHHEMKKLENLLPKRIKTKITDIDSLDMRENINQILEKVITDLQENESRKEIKQIEELEEKAPVRSVTGMQDTIKLMEEGRADLLIIPGYKTYQGWKCDGCLYVAKDQYQAGCPHCDNSLKETDLIEEAVRLAFRNNSKIELVKDKAAEKLEKYEGIGALVRY